MNVKHGVVLGLALAFWGSVCSAQANSIPFAQIAQDAQLSARLEVPFGVAKESSSLDFSTAEPGELSGAGFVRSSIVAVPRTVDSKFILLNGLHLGMAAFDVEMTQHCIATHQCREGNPIMPSSRVGQISVNFALVGYGSFVSYRLKKRGSKLWLLSPTTGAAAHAVGVATGLMHR